MARLNTQTRLIALLCLVVAVFVGAYLILRHSQDGEAAAMLAGLQSSRAELLGDLLDLTGESLKTFNHDYSYWDEMVGFVGTGDPEWGRTNIAVSLATFHAQGAWVLRPDGSQVYGVVEGIDPSFGQLPLPAGPLSERLQRDKFAHFFARNAAGLMEFRAAPIQPTADRARTSPPQGWFIIARLWDTPHLDAFRRVVDGTLAIDDVRQPAPPPEDALVVRVQHTLPDWQGLPLVVLRSDYRPEPLALLLRDNEKDKLLFLSFGGVIVIVLAFGLSRWVLRPLGLLERSLKTKSAAALEALPESPDIFGRLARLAADSFKKQRVLEREVEERRRVEAALRASQQSLVSSAGLRSRLARDLHDGVIQSIYAAGLGLESLRSVLRQDPDAAELRIDAAQSSLNQTLREVRSFIQGLEPEGHPRPDFAQALQTLVSNLRSLHLIDIRCQHELAPERLTAREEVHALQIVRECVSNAIRHGHASQITVRLTEADSAPVLGIEDNGRGFVPADVDRTAGSGLRNLSARAGEISAQLTIDSAPGNGTRVFLRFAQR